MHTCAQPSLEHVVAICAKEPRVARETHLSVAMLGSSGTCAAELEGAPVDYVRACRSHRGVCGAFDADARSTVRVGAWV